MREIDEDLRAALAKDATTLCHCWRLHRRDGVVLGFTDHDGDLSFGGTVFQAASGFAAGDREAVSGLAAPSGDVEGVLSSELIAEADLAAGRFDGARVEQFLVDWTAPARHIRLNVMEVGEISRSGDAFRVELRSLAHRLGQTRGRIYGRRCDADFGDPRCGKHLADYTATGVVAVAPDATRMSVTGLDDFASGHFRHGLLTFESGALQGQSTDIQSHVRAHGSVQLVFWLPLPATPAPGDTFRITAGCDKSFDTCKARFGNSLNFRGFPHMPGQDFAYSYADGETEHDGEPLYE